jgi:hypothetical protein
MEQTAFKFDETLIDDALARIQGATRYVGSLHGRLPDDLRGLSLLRLQVEELRRGLIVLTALADALQHVHDRQTAQSGAPAWAMRSAPRGKRG